MRFELHNNVPTTEQMNFRPFQAFLRLLEKLNGKLSLEDRIELAHNLNTPPETLTILAQDEYEDVRYWVARNTNTPQETLPILAQDESWYVRWGVADNPNTPPEILTILAQDEDVDVRATARQNPNYNPVKELKVNVKQYEALKALLATSQDADLKSIQF
jgi:hypothetical protein